MRTSEEAAQTIKDVRSGGTLSFRQRQPEIELNGDAAEEADERTADEMLGRYWHTWHRCTTDEQLVLIHLATEGFVNPKQARAVRHLLARRVLVRGPSLRFRSSRFQTFVRRAAERIDLAAIERPGVGLGWPELRWILICLLMIIAVFLYTTQQAMFQTTLGLVSALGIALPALLKAVKLAYDLRGDQRDV
jgi:hypothetical protein